VTISPEWRRGFGSGEKARYSFKVLMSLYLSAILKPMVNYKGTLDGKANLIWAPGRALTGSQSIRIRRRSSMSRMEPGTKTKNNVKNNTDEKGTNGVRIKRVQAQRSIRRYD